MLLQELRDLYASAWRDDVPEEDREWAESYRHSCMDEVNRRRRGAVAQSAYEGYLQSSDGLFDGQPATPWRNLSVYDSNPWCALVDAVEDGVTGVLVPPGDVDALRASLRELLEDRDRRVALGTAGRERARATWSREASAASLREALADAVSRRGSGRAS